MKLELNKHFKKSLTKRIQKFEFEAGILKDGPHYEPAPDLAFGKPNLKTFAGGPARKQSRQKSSLSKGEILVENMKRLNINILLKPFQNKSSDLLKFTNAYLKMVFKETSNIKRVENLLQAVIRNPILKKEYGSNSGSTIDRKGFDRNIIDTSQTFKAILTKARRV